LSIYDIVGVPFGYLMRIIYKICGNYPVSIILFTVVANLILLPIRYKNQKGTSRMQLLQPKLDKLKKSYANNPQKLQEEQQKLYQQEGYNPMGSCLPMFLQMFMLFGVIDVIYKPITHILRISRSVREAAVEVASKLIVEGGGKELSFKNLRCELYTMEQLSKTPAKFANLGEDFLDKVSAFNEKFTIFGANLGQTPNLHPEEWTKEALVLCLIPFAAGVAQLISSIYSQLHQKKVNPTMQAGGCMWGMTLVLPLWSIWLAFTFPAGIGFYWICSAIVNFIITFALNQYFTIDRIKAINEKEKAKAKEYAEKHPGKKTFMQKIMEQQAIYDEELNKARVNENGDKISRSEMNKQNRDRIKEARKRMAEKYGDDFDENDKED